MKTIIQIMIYLVIAGISFFVFRIITNVFSGFSSIGDKLESSVDQRLKDKKSFKAKKLYLSKQGIMYRLNDYDLAPSKYLVLRLVVGAGVALAGYLTVNGSVIISLIGGVAGFFACDLIFRRLNKKDNNNMINDLFNVYLTLKIQLSSGIYIINSLVSACELISSKRLRYAIEELIINLSDKTITYIDAIEWFQNRFSCEEINDFCTFLHSYAKYGVSEKYLEDVMFEINEIATQSAMRQEHAMQTKVTLLSFLYFACILAIVIFCAVKSFNGLSIF